MNRELTIKMNIYGLAVVLMAILTGCIYRPGTGYSFEDDDELFEEDTMNDIGDDTTGGIDPYQYLYGEGPGSAKCAWESAYDTGSIMALADKKWAEDNAPDFHVSTPEELASVVYYVNTTLGVKVNVTIENDIDLTGYDWMPMGWSEFQKGTFYFSGTVDGGGHTIQGMHIDLGISQCAFIGYGCDTVVHDITFKDAYVHGATCTGIVGGEIYGTHVWENVCAEGEVVGSTDDCATIIGREAAITFINCDSKNVIVNGNYFKYPSYKMKKIAETPVTETFCLELNDDCLITRDDHEGFQTLSWYVERDGVEIAQWGAVDYYGVPDMELEPDEWLGSDPGTYKVYLVAFIDGTYIRVSNVVEYIK